MDAPLGSLECTQEARVTSRNSYASFVLSKFPASIHNSIYAHYSYILYYKTVQLSYPCVGHEKTVSESLVHIFLLNICVQTERAYLPRWVASLPLIREFRNYPEPSSNASFLPFVSSSLLLLPQTLH